MTDTEKDAKRGRMPGRPSVYAERCEHTKKNGEPCPRGARPAEPGQPRLCCKCRRLKRYRGLVEAAEPVAPPPPMPRRDPAAAVPVEVSAAIRKRVPVHWHTRTNPNRKALVAERRARALRALARPG